MYGAAAGYGSVTLSQCRAEITESKRVKGPNKKGEAEKGKKHTAYVIHCRNGEVEWTIEKRFSEFKAFRKKLISSGAGPLKNVQFPRKTLSRHSSSHKTDSKRVPILQGWLNLVISVYSGQPSLAPEISEFLDTEQQNANTARLTISRHMAPFGPDPHLIAGDWVASGVNAFKNGEIETERFTIEVQEDGSLSGRATDPDAAGSGQDYTLDNVAIKPHPQDDSLVILEFHQVYSDGTRTGWFAGVDRAHINLTGGVWMALSGKHKDQQVGTFSAQKILMDAEPGVYRIISEDGALVRDGKEKTSNALAKLDDHEVVKVEECVRRDDGVMRLRIVPPPSFQPGQDGYVSESVTGEYWISERKETDQSLVSERLTGEEAAEALASLGKDLQLLIVPGGLVQDVAVNKTLVLSGVRDLAALHAAVLAELGKPPATRVDVLYQDKETETFVRLNHLDACPAKCKIQVFPAVEAPLAASEPEPEPMPAPAAAPRSLKLLCHVGEVGTTPPPQKVNLENIADLTQLVGQLRLVGELRTRLDELGVPPAGPIAVHLLQGAELGSRVSDLSQLRDTEPICLVAEGEGVPPAAATATPEAVPGGTALTVLVAANDVVQSAAKVQGSYGSVEQLTAALKRETRVTADVKIQQEGGGVVTELSQLQNVEGKSFVQVTLVTEAPSRWRCCSAAAS